MSEEFLEDIIAANDSVAGTEQDAVADIAKAIDQPEAVDAGKEADKAASASIDETDKSSSTPDAVVVDKTADTVTGSETDSVAPGAASEVEELASQLGWNKDHKGAEAVDAATYILRSKDIQKTMKDHNKDLKNQLTGLNGSIDALKDHNTRVYQADVKKLQGELTRLKAEKKAAVELADVARVEMLDQQIEDVQKDIAEPVKESAPTSNPAYDDWIADNAWYLTDDDMAKYADAVADQYAGAPLDRVYALVRQKVAEVFPDKFEAEATGVETTAAVAEVAKTPAKVVGPTSPVEAANRTTDSASFTKADLSPEQQTIMTQFVKGGIMTEEQYIADIAKMQGA